jgi:antitoxin ParD1/3/4
MNERTMATASLHISLPETLKEYVTKRVEEGAFSNPSDFVRALIRADRERQAKREALVRDLQLGIDELDRGEGIPAEQVFRKLEEKFGRAE